MALWSATSVASNYGYSVDKNVAYGYVYTDRITAATAATTGVDADADEVMKNKWLKEQKWEVQVRDRQNVAAKFSVGCVFDPKGLRPSKGEYDGEMF